MTRNYNCILDHKFIKIDKDKYIAVIKAKNTYIGRNMPACQPQWYTVTWDEIKPTKAKALRNKIVLTKNEILDIAEQYEKFQEDGNASGVQFTKVIEENGLTKQRRFRKGELRKFFTNGMRQALTPEDYQKYGVPVSIGIKPDPIYGKSQKVQKILNNKIKLEHPVYLGKTIEALIGKLDKEIKECSTEQKYVFDVTFPDKLDTDYIKEKKAELEDKRNRIKKKIKQLSLL